MNHTRTILLALLFCITQCVAAQTTLTHSVEQVGETRLAQPAPAFALLSRDGGVLSLKKLLKNERPLLLSFWASWCQPCKEGLPRIQRWVDQRRGRGQSVPDVICFNFKDSAEKAAQTWAGLGLELPYELDRYGAVYERFAGKDWGRLPLTVLINSSGIVTLILTAEGKDLSAVLDAAMESAPTVDGDQE